MPGFPDPFRRNILRSSCLNFRSCLTPVHVKTIPEADCNRRSGNAVSEYAGKTDKLPWRGKAAYSKILKIHALKFKKGGQRGNPLPFPFFRII